MPGIVRFCTSGFTVNLIVDYQENTESLATAESDILLMSLRHTHEFRTRTQTEYPVVLLVLAGVLGAAFALVFLKFLAQ